MNKDDILLEIGLEEMPATDIPQTIQQLQTMFTTWLNKQQIGFGEVHAYATPRRLALHIRDVDEKQADQNNVARGPAKHIAVDENGGWTKAAQGFARSQGVDVNELEIREHKGTPYVFAEQIRVGKETTTMLPAFRDEIVRLRFSKSMRWGTGQLRYIRPIRWIVFLFGASIIPIEIEGVSASNVSYGHRFLGSTITISTPEQYASQLEEQYVIPSWNKRKKMITNQLHQLEETNEWNIHMDEDLLEEVTGLVEFPSPVVGAFDKEFLEIPDDVLITSMEEHQRYFAVRDSFGELLPYFVTIRNGKEDTKRIVSKGNEKVLHARLADARFFYEEDQKISIDKAMERLKRVVFHEELGTVYEKVKRIKYSALQLAATVSADEEAQKSLARAASICKFDLVTLMVDEFPTLQGRMGEEYALKAGEPVSVATAIYEQYLPRYNGDKLPRSVQGAILSICDKLDTLVGLFAIGQIPSGSQDPYALRRQAASIVELLLTYKWRLSLKQLIEIAIDAYDKQGSVNVSKERVAPTLMDFIHTRLKTRLQSDHVRYDVIDSVLAVPDQPIIHVFEKATIMMDHVASSPFKTKVEAFVRVLNIADKNDDDGKNLVMMSDTSIAIQVRRDLFTQDEESNLYRACRDVEKQLSVLYDAEKWSEMYRLLDKLEQPIHDFFDHVMVMVENDTLRQNRLALVFYTAAIIRQWADWRQIVISGDAE